MKTETQKLKAHIIRQPEKDREKDTVKTVSLPLPKPTTAHGKHVSKMAAKERIE